MTRLKFSNNYYSSIRCYYWKLLLVTVGKEDDARVRRLHGRT